jgi:hypothetical protein
VEVLSDPGVHHTPIDLCCCDIHPEEKCQRTLAINTALEHEEFPNPALAERDQVPLPACNLDCYTITSQWRVSAGELRALTAMTTRNATVCMLEPTHASPQLPPPLPPGARAGNLRAPMVPTLPRILELKHAYSQCPRAASRCRCSIRLADRR